MSNDSRAEFENWYAEDNGVDTSHKIFNKTGDGSYLYMRTRMDLEIWQARDAEVAELRSENERIKELASSIRDLLSSCDVDCLGTGEALDCAPWPIRDEVIHNITVAIE